MTAHPDKGSRKSENGLGYDEYNVINTWYVAALNFLPAPERTQLNLNSFPGLKKPL